MTIIEKRIACETFFNKLCKLLEDTYEVVGSCNKDCSVYLVPIGTASEISYYSKPARSFRISDHWNWYTSTRKCSDESYIQCESLDMPRPRRREEPGKATKPRRGVQVAYIGSDGKYHAIYGEVFDRATKTWTWISTDPSNIITVL